MPVLTRPAPKVEPPRLVINTVEGWGKTTIGAYAPDPAILMAKGETGYLTLLGAKRVPQALAATINTWPETLAMVDSLIADPQGVKTLVLDALGGYESMCHQHVCDRDFKGDWGDHGFLSYHQGFELSVKEWLKLLVKLDTLRDTHGIGIIALSHAQVRPFKNPTGEDYDRFAADCHPKTWAPTHKWADAVLFGDFRTIIDEKRGAKAKAVNCTAERVVYTERRGAWDAKNRYGMPESFLLPNDPAQSWTTINNAINGASNA